MDDDRLLRDVADVLRRIDPIPPDVTLAARSAIAWRNLDAEIAELLHDSAVEAGATAGVRSGGGWRALTFESATGVAIEVEVEAAGTRRTITGRIVPGTSARIVVRLPGAELPIEADDLGRFHAADLAAGPFSLRCEFDGQAIETGWVTI